MPQAAQKKEHRVTRKPVTADEQAPAVRAIAHDTFIRRPNTDAIARQFGIGRANVVDAICYEIHRRVARIEQHLGFPSSDALPIRSARQVVIEMRSRAVA